MTKSDNPNDKGPNYGHPPRQPNYGQPAVPAQPGVGGYVQDPQQMAQPPEAVPGQTYQPAMVDPYAVGQVPVQQQQQMAGQLPPQAPATDPYGEYVAQPAPGQPPLDDYQYPQGQPILPEVPSVAVPPTMVPATGQTMQAQQQTTQTHVAATTHQVGEGGYADPASVGGAGEQISQRLAQLQSQYDEEVSGENWNAQQNTQQVPAQTAPATMTPGGEAYAGYQAPAEEMPVYPPLQAEDPQQQAYQQIPPQQAFQQAPEAFQPGQQPPPPEQQQPEQYAQPPMSPPQGSYEYGNPPDGSQQQYAQPTTNYAAGPSIAQETPEGGGMKKVILGGAFVAALAVGGGGAYTYQYTDLLGSRQGSKTAPTIKAAGSPIKIIKKKITSAKDSINKAMGRRLGDGGTEKLMQKTVNGAKVAGDNIAAAKSGMLPGLDSRAGKTSIRTNAPRRVRTLIVRPDGTILRPAGSGSGSLMAGSNATNVAVAPGINLANIPKAKDVTRAGGNKIRRMKTVGEASIARRLGETSGSTVKKTIVKSKARPIVRKVRPVKPVVAPKINKVAVAAPVAGNIGTPFVVQVTSRSSQTSALAAFADMQQKYPSLIGTYSPDIQRADLGTKGIWYRLRVGPVGSKTAATDLCSSLKQAGHPGCFVRRK